MSSLDVFWLAVFAPLAFLSIQISRRILNHWLTPLSIFVGVNAASISLYHLRLLEMTDVSAKTHSIVLSSFAMFFLGFILAVGRGAPLDKPAGPDRIDGGHLAAFFYLTASLAAAGWISQLAAFVLTHGLGTLLGNIWMLQDRFQLQFLGYLNLIGILVLPAYVLRRVIGSSKRSDLLVVLASVFGLLLTGVKGYLIYSVFAALLTWSVANPGSFRLKHLASGMLIMFGFFVLYTSKIDIFAVDYYGGSQGISKMPMLKRPYLYFVGSWPAMEFIVDGTLSDLPRFGYVVLEPIWKIFGGLGLAEIMTKANREFVVIGKTTFNVYSLIGEIYWDLKWPGLLVVSGLLGHASTRLYLRARREPYWGHALVYATLAHGMAISFFSYIYTLNVVVILLYIYFVGFVLLRRGVMVERARRD